MASPTAWRSGRGSVTCPSSAATTSSASQGVPSLNRRSHGSVRRDRATWASRSWTSPVKSGAGCDETMSAASSVNRGADTSASRTWSGAGSWATPSTSDTATRLVNLYRPAGSAVVTSS